MEDNHRQILQLLTCGDGTQSTRNEDGKESEIELQFDKTASAAPWNSMLKVPELKPVQLKGDDEKIAAQYDPKDISPATLRVVQSIVSRLDIRDMIRADAFFETLAEMPSDIEPKTYAFGEFTKHPYANFDD